MRAFILSEILVVIAILLILALISIPVLRFFQKESNLKNSVEEILNILRVAQSETLSSEGASEWGVYFNTTTEPDQYVLFKGNSYSARDPLFDEIYGVLAGVEIYQINLAGGGTEIIFDRVTGVTNQPGQISLRLKDDFSKNQTIYIESSGQLGLTVPSAPRSLGRVRDSRHVHFEYSRAINIATERIVLTFSDGAPVVVEIMISSNLEAGQFYWEGEVVVGSDIQKIKIHTHRLNSGGTQFSIHRDRRYNNKALTIDINDSPSDPDPGTLITYTAEGETAIGTSIYVSDLQWQ